MQDCKTAHNLISLDMMQRKDGLNNCKRCACPPRPSRARSVCGSTASSRAGQVAIQAWTGSGVVGQVDVMRPQESPRHRASWAGSCLGLLVGLGLRRDWACSLRHVSLVSEQVERRLVCLTCPFLGCQTAGWRASLRAGLGMRSSNW